MDSALRRTRDVFERFTERAQRVVRLAQDEARAMGHDHVGTEHLLIGLLREQDGLGGNVLRELGVGVDQARAAVLMVVPRGEKAPRGQIRWTARAKHVLELALREALSLGHSFIGTEHLLLGLVREVEGLGARVLADVGADAEAVRGRIFTLLGGPAVVGPRARRPSAPPARRAGVDWPAALLSAAASFAESRGRAPAVRVTLADGERLDVESIRPGVVGEIIGFVAYEAEGGTRLVLVRPEGIARADVTVDPGGRGFLGLRPEPPEP